MGPLTILWFIYMMILAPHIYANYNNFKKFEFPKYLQNFSGGCLIGGLLEKIELRARDFLNKVCQPKFITSPDWLWGVPEELLPIPAHYRIPP